MGDILRRRALLSEQTATPSERGLIHNWDFTKSLTDTVGGVVAVLRNKGTVDPVRNSEGVEFDQSRQECYLIGNFDVRNKRIEVDVATFEQQSTNGHCSFLMCGDSTAYTDLSSGIIGRSSAFNINAWNGSWDGSSTPLADISGKTVRVDVDASGYPTVYLNGTLVKTFSVLFGNGTKGEESVRIGNTRVVGSGGTFYNAIISGARIYDLTQI